MTAPLRSHEGHGPISAHVEIRGEQTAFGQPMLRLVVGQEWIGMTAEAAFAFSLHLQDAVVHLFAGTTPSPTDPGWVRHGDDDRG